MTNINIFKIANKGLELQLAVTTDVGATITTIRLWDQDSFKDYSKAEELSNLIVGDSNTETITITASSVNRQFFDGIYFIEIEDSNGGVSQLGVAVDLSRFMYCLMEYLCKINIQCASCDNELFKALTMKLYIDNLRSSLQLASFTTAITFWKNLNRSCKRQCVECRDISYLGYGIIDGLITTPQ